MHEVLFYLLLVLLPTQLGYHTWPDWAMVLGRRIDFLSPTLYVTDIITFLILLFWFLKGKMKFSFHIYLLIAVSVAVLNVLMSGNRLVSLYFWVKVLEFGLLGVYIHATKPKFSTVLFYLAIGVFYSSLIAIGQFLLQRSIGGPLWYLGERTFTADTPGIARFFVRSLMLRAYATFPHPNVLGGYLALLLPLIAAGVKNKRPVFYVTTLMVGSIALVLTFSRSAWIAFMIGVLLLFIKKKIFIPLFVAMIVAMYLIVGTLGLQDETVTVRQQLNVSAMNMFLETPLIGKGLGNFLTSLPDHLVSRQIYFLQPVHNIFLLILAETGIIGFALFIRLLWERRRKWILIPMIFLGFTDHYFLTLQQGQLLFVLMLTLTII